MNPEPFISIKVTFIFVDSHQSAEFGLALTVGAILSMFVIFIVSVYVVIFPTTSLTFIIIPDVFSEYSL